MGQNRGAKKKHSKAEETYGQTLFRRRTVRRGINALFNYNRMFRDVLVFQSSRKVLYRPWGRGPMHKDSVGVLSNFL